MMSTNLDDLSAAVRYALETTRATTVCPFHDEVIIRVGDDKTCFINLPCSRADWHRG